MPFCVEVLMDVKARLAEEGLLNAAKRREMMLFHIGL